VVVLLAAACGSGGDVATGAAGSDPPGIECPALGSGRGEVPGDARVAGYTDADLDELVEQRHAFDLCDVPADHLFDDPRSIDLYEEHGIVLLPEEEQSWLDYQARYRPAREAVEVMRGQDGFLKARSNVRAGTITVWVTSDSLERQRAVAVRLGAEEGLQLETVRYDLSEMKLYRDELLASLPPAVADSIIEVDIEPDRLVVFIEGESEDVDRAGALIESRSNLVGEGVEVEVRPGEKNTGTGDLCPSRTRCAPLGGGLALSLDSGETCSTGPVVVDPQGRRALSTAGHCVDGDVKTTNLRSNRNDSRSAPNGVPRIGFPVLRADFEDGGVRDFGAVYRSGEVHFVQNLVRRDNAKPLNEVRGSAQAIDDELVCLSAVNAQARRCGPVVDASTSFTYEDEDVEIEGMVEVDLSAAPAEPGDSGGTYTVMNDDVIVLGVHGGSSDEEHAFFSQSLPPGWSYFTGDEAEYGGAQVRNAVATFFDSGLLRTPDGAGLSYWSNRVGDADVCVPELRTANRSFLTGAEFRSGVGATLSTAGRRIRRLYWTALDRNPTGRDEEYWQAQLSIRMQGGQNIDQAWGSIVSVITATAEATTRYTRACQLQ
jgi:hypothetical protein